MARVQVAGFLFVLVFPAQFLLAGFAFPQGVASGDVWSDRAICWTRTSSAGSIRIDISHDAGFAQISATTVITASADTGLAIKYEATSLNPALRYFFRFTRIDTGEVSPTGTFVTAPAPETEHSFRFVYTGDANAARQPFRVLNFAADESPDLWFLAGDTIYGDQAAGDLGIATDLTGYRDKYAQNRSDPALQRLSATASAWVQWDDHEVTNDYDGGEPESDIAPQQIADAYQAFFENQPIRDQGVSGDLRRIYRSFRYGSLVEFFVLDCRQYRSRDAGRDGGDIDPYGFILPTRDPAVIARLQDPSRTMLGAAQLAWLKQGLAASTARWKFILSSVTFTSLLVMPYDRWDGYDAERFDLLHFIDENRIDGAVLLSADIHGNTYNPDVTYYLRNSLGQSFTPDFRVPEFVTGPIGQATIRQEISEFAAGTLNLPPFLLNCPLLFNLLVDFAQNQVYERNHLAFLEPNRYAYLVVDVTSQGLTLTHKGIPADSSDATSPIATLSTVTLPEPSLCGALPANLLMSMMLLCGPGLSFVLGRRRRRPPRQRTPER
ncbi:MAG: alkaline phosphatase D family protein [Planctomycetota bacterium]